jgi:hypothetical protein
MKFLPFKKILIIIVLIFEFIFSPQNNRSEGPLVTVEKNGLRGRWKSGLLRMRRERWLTNGIRFGPSLF